VAIITLTTDFGRDSPYVAAMKGAILCLHPQATLVDITHSVPPQNIQQGAIVLADVTPYFPAGTIHVAVVDPGVGTARAIVYAEIAGQRYVCPDNGLLTALLRRQPATLVHRVTNPAHWAQTVSATFHGRDIMGPVAARLSLGLSPAELGPLHPTLTTIEWREAVAVAGKVQGVVESIDSFGNLISNIDADKLVACRDLGERVRIECDGHETFGIFRTYGDVEPQTFVAIVGSTNKLELSITGENAAELLGIRVGTPVTITW
jgi:S-adenosylmethionine hydrolase